MDKARFEKLKKIKDAVNKNLGKSDAVTFLGNDEITPMPRFTSGSVAIDEALGGGWPKGKIVELFGKLSSGKSTICYHALAEYQKAYPDDEVVLIDTENSWDPGYAKTLGVEVDRVLIDQPEDGEEAINAIIAFINEGCKMFVIDSVAALIPRAATEGDFRDTSEGMGAQARLLSDALKRLQPLITKNEVTMFFTNQTRNKIGKIYGSPTTTPGGNALGFYCSIRCEVVPMEKDVTEGEDGKKEYNGTKTKVKIVKNKTFPPFREGEFFITYGRGIDRVVSVFDSAVERKIIEKAGSWYSFNGNKLGQGQNNCIELLRDNDAMVSEIENKLKSLAQQKLSKPKKAAVEDNVVRNPVE